MRATAAVPVLAAFKALRADPDKDEHRLHKGRPEHLCIGRGCVTWIDDSLPSVLCAVCLIRLRRSRGLQGDGSIAPIAP